jgi:hypothetical protein
MKLRLTSGYGKLAEAKGSEFELELSLRDYFAAQALVALIEKFPWDTEAERLAAWAYAQADAMLAARGATP